MPIKLEFKGFSDFLEDIQAADGSMEATCDSIVRQSAQILQSEIKAEMTSAGVPSDLISQMPQFTVQKSGNVFTAYVGYPKGNFDADNLSTAHKVIFLNYGTPHRKKHGQIEKRGFNEIARKKARPKIRKAEKAALQKIFARLKK